MNNKFSEALSVVLLIGFMLVASWLGVGAIVKAICYCFGWPFTLKIGTGVWLCIWAFNLFIAKGGSE